MTLEDIGEPIPVGEAKSCAFSSDAARIALGFGSDARCFELWDVKNRKRISRVDHAAPRLSGFNFMRFTPDGKRIVCREWNHGGSVHVYDGVTGELLCFLDTTEGAGLAMSPDSRSIAIGRTDNSIAVWDLVEEKRTALLTGHLYPVHQLAWSPDGKCLASSAGSGSLRLWHVPTSREIGSIDGNSAFRFLEFGSRGGTLYAKVYGGDLKIWKIPSLEETEAGY